MKTLKLIGFFIVIIFLVGGACPSNDSVNSNKIAASEIYQSYSVDEEGSNLVATAFFRVGGNTGTTVALSAPAKITFNGQPMTPQLNTSNGSFYRLTVPKNNTEGVFQYTDQNGKVYTNKISFGKVDLMGKNLSSDGKSPLQISLSRPIPSSGNSSLEWTSGSARDSEMIGDIFDVSFSQTKNAIIVKPKVLAEIPRGNVTFKLKVNEYRDIQQGTTLGGSLSYEYETTPLTVVIGGVSQKPVAKTANTNVNSVANTQTNKNANNVANVTASSNANKSVQNKVANSKANAK